MYFFIPFSVPSMHLRLFLHFWYYVPREQASAYTVCRFAETAYQMALRQIPHGSMPEFSNALEFTIVRIRETNARTSLWLS